MEAETREWWLPDLPGLRSATRHEQRENEDDDLDVIIDAVARLAARRALERSPSSRDFSLPRGLLMSKSASEWYAAPKIEADLVSIGWSSSVVHALSADRKTFPMSAVFALAFSSATITSGVCLAATGVLGIAETALLTVAGSGLFASTVGFLRLSSRRKDVGLAPTQR